MQNTFTLRLYEGQRTGCAKWEQEQWQVRRQFPVVLTGFKFDNELGGDVA
jgi:hypothetical protein